MQVELSNTVFFVSNLPTMGQKYTYHQAVIVSDQRLKLRGVCNFELL
jgi:hypothetical protein